MKNNFDACLKVTLEWEGGYSNHPNDPGGPTMKGVTQREFTSWLQHQGLKPRNVKSITDAELQTIYRNEYWLAAGCENLDAGLDLCVFDEAVNSGVSRAKHYLELAGPDVDHYQAQRHAYVKEIAFPHGARGKLAVFLNGWENRINDITLHAHKMVMENANS